MMSAARIRQKSAGKLLIHFLGSHGENVRKLGELFLPSNQLYCVEVTHDDILQIYRHHDIGKAFIDYIVIERTEEDELIDGYPKHVSIGSNRIKQISVWSSRLASNFAHELVKRHHDFSTSGVIKSLLSINASLRKFELCEPEIHALWNLFVHALYCLKQADDMDASIFTVIVYPEGVSPLILSRAGDDFFIIEAWGRGKNINIRISSDIIRKQSVDLEYHVASVNTQEVESLGETENTRIKVNPHRLFKLMEEGKEVYNVKVNFL